MSGTTAIQASSRGLVLRNLDDMQRWAEGVQKSGLSPKTLNTTSQIIVATQYGMELGLTPMAALNSIAVIGGKPSLYGDAALALVYKSGLCEYVEESVEGSGEEMTAVCRAKRKDQKKEIVRTFDVADAKQAKLWGKSGTWSTHPNRMLKYKARGFCLRDLFPDILMGMHLFEEMQGEVEETLPAPECKIPRRQDRRKVESTDVTPEEAVNRPASTDYGTEANPGDTAQYSPQEILDKVLEQYAELSGMDASDPKLAESFQIYAADVLSCHYGDVDLNDISVAMLTKIQFALDLWRDEMEGAE